MLVDAGLGTLVDLARQAQHLEPPLQTAEHKVESSPEVDGLEDLLPLGDLDLRHTRHQVGQCSGLDETLHGAEQFLRDLRQKLQDFERSFPELDGARFHFAVDRLGFVDATDARHRERIARKVFGDAKAL